MKKQPRAIPYYDNLCQALEQAYCPLCRLLVEGADRYIDAMLWAMVNDPDSREIVRRSRGFCHQHAWMLVRGGAALGVTIVMDSVLRALLDVLAANPAEGMPAAGALHHLRRALRLPRPEAADTLTNELAPQVPCPVCVDAQQLEQGYTRTLLEHMSGPKSLAEAYRHSDGLCLPHFQSVLKEAIPGESLQTLLNAQQAIWQKLQAELAEFIRKNDHRFTHEPIGEEGDAWQRALAAISGPRLETFWRSSNLFKRR